MGAHIQRLVTAMAIGIEVLAALIIAAGAIEAVFGVVQSFARRPPAAGARKQVWLHFSMWLLLGLEFELAADIIDTAISPNWSDIGQLAAIVAIRTTLNFFLGRDLDTFREAAPR
ncbi:MAG: DUF1622 domain-containing protein [Terriglobales bacterium]